MLCLPLVFSDKDKQKKKCVAIAPSIAMTNGSVVNKTRSQTGLMDYFYRLINPFLSRSFLEENQRHKKVEQPEALSLCRPVLKRIQFLGIGVPQLAG